MKKHIEIGELQKTLIFPLLSRRRELDQEEPVLVDEFSRIVDDLDIDISEFDNLLSNENHRLSMVVRAYHFDNLIKDFMQDHPDAAIISIGAGLDTTFKRVDNGQILWFNIELPDVAELREQLIGDSERETTIRQSVFDFDWTEKVKTVIGNRPVMIVSAGVLFYFTEDQVRSILLESALAFPGAHFVFDSVIRFTRWAQNRDIKKGNNPMLAKWNWHLRKPEHLKKWLPDLEVVESFPIYERLRIRAYWTKDIIRGIKVLNFLKLYSINHVIL